MRLDPRECQHATARIVASHAFLIPNQHVESVGGGGRCDYPCVDPQARSRLATSRLAKSRHTKCNCNGAAVPAALRFGGGMLCRLRHAEHVLCVTGLSAVVGRRCGNYGSSSLASLYRLRLDYRVSHVPLRAHHAKCLALHKRAHCKELGAFQLDFYENLPLVSPRDFNQSFQVLLNSELCMKLTALCA